MKHYAFEVLNDGAVIVGSHTMVLPNLAAVWSRIADLAREVEGPGYKIRVKDETGGIVILVGAATARPIRGHCGLSSRA